MKPTKENVVENTVAVVKKEIKEVIPGFKSFVLDAVPVYGVDVDRGPVEVAALTSGTEVLILRGPHINQAGALWVHIQVQNEDMVGYVFWTVFKHSFKMLKVFS